MIKLAESIEVLVGDAKIDSEHLELIALINLINHHALDKKYEFQLPSLIIIFSSELQTHFYSEEDLLAKVNSTALAAHRLEHQRIMEVTLRYLKELTEIPNDIAKIFRDMLIEHIRTFNFTSLKEPLDELQKKKD
jgi:hemerythrin-like metal-binding protein